MTGLSASQTYYFAIKSTDQAVPANTSAISNVISGTTQPPIQPVVVHNPWLKNDRVADTHNITTMGQTYINSYTPNGVIAPADDQAKAINIYDNQKRRLYHWGMEPPGDGSVIPLSALKQKISAPASHSNHETTFRRNSRLVIGHASRRLAWGCGGSGGRGPVR